MRVRVQRLRRPEERLGMRSKTLVGVACALHMASCLRHALCALHVTACALPFRVPRLRSGGHRQWHHTAC